VNIKRINSSTGHFSLLYLSNKVQYMLTIICLL